MQSIPSLLMRLRLGHCGIERGLALIRKHPDGKYQCGQSEAILLECNLYTGHRKKLQKDLTDCGETTFSLRTLLILGAPGKLEKLMVYLHSTGLYQRI